MSAKHDRRPWGYWEIIDEGSGFKVKRLTILPGQRLSLQKHRYRDEHWVVVQGAAEVVCGSKSLKLRRNQFFFIPKETRHRLSNQGKKNLIVIEVATGVYLGEDDIARFEDDYGRT